MAPQLLFQTNLCWSQFQQGFLPAWNGSKLVKLEWMVVRHRRARSFPLGCYTLPRLGPTGEVAMFLRIAAASFLSAFLLSACEQATTPQETSICQGLSQSDCTAKSECQWNTAKSQCEAR